MATDSEVMKEFLIGLGFKIDEAGMKKFVNSLAGSNKAALAVGGSLVGAAFAVEKFVESVASGMEKLYYASQRTHASALNLRSVDQAFQQVGFSAGQSTAFIEKFAENIRASGGAMAGFIKGQFGIDTDTMDRAEAFKKIIIDLVNYAREGPAQRAIAGQRAGMLFGMSDSDFENIFNNLDDFIEKLDQAKARIGENTDEFKKITAESREFNNQLRTMGQEITDIATQIEAKLLPSGIKWAKALTGDLDALKRHDFWEFWQRQVNAMNYFIHGVIPNPRGPTEADKKRARDPGRVDAVEEDIIAAIEKRHGLEPGTMMAVRDVESSGGTNLIGKPTNGQQAFGPFQISNSNFAALGMTRADAMDTGKSGEAWATMFEQNLKEFNNDYVKAIAATNSNPQHVREAVKLFGNDWLAHMNKETRDFVVRVDAALGKYHAGAERMPARKSPDGTPSAAAGAGTTVNLTQNIEINGTDANANGQAVAQHTKRTIGDVTRDTRGLSATPRRGA